MTSSTSLKLLSVVCPLLLFFLAIPGIGTVWALAPLVCSLPVLLIGVSAGSGRPPWLGLLAVWTLLCGSWLLLGYLAVHHDLTNPSAALALAVLTIMLFGMGVVPLILVGWLYAASSNPRAASDGASAGPVEGGGS